MLKMWSLSILISHPKIPYDTQLKLQGPRNILEILHIEPKDFEEASKKHRNGPQRVPKAALSGSRRSFGFHFGTHS